MKMIFVLCAIVAGISNPLQSAGNSALLKSIQGPVVAAFIVYAVGTVCLPACVPFVGLPLRESLSKLSSAPWWVYIGGACNAIFLMASLLITRRLGSATFTTIVVISAVLTSVLLDHFGWLGFEIHRAGAMRLTGVALAIVSVVLIARY